MKVRQKSIEDLFTAWLQGTSIANIECKTSMVKSSNSSASALLEHNFSCEGLRVDAIRQKLSEMFELFDNDVYQVENLNTSIKITLTNENLNVTAWSPLFTDEYSIDRAKETGQQAAKDLQLTIERIKYNKG